MKPRPRHKGQSPRSKAHDDQVNSVEALRSVQSVNGATKGLRVEAFMCVVSRMLHHSYIFSSFFPGAWKWNVWDGKQFTSKNEKQPIVSELTQSLLAKAVQMVRLDHVEVVKDRHCESQAIEGEGPPKRLLQNHRSPQPLFFIFF